MPTKRKARKTTQRTPARKTKTKILTKTRLKAKAKAKTKGEPAVTRTVAVQVSPAALSRTGQPATPRTIFDILHPGAAAGIDPNFRDAPSGWTADHARILAAEVGLELAADHWEVIRVLQGCYKDEIQPRIRLLRDALEARFAHKGGMKYLFSILPSGPIAQGCTLAGVKPPHGARDLSFGSVA